MIRILVTGRLPLCRQLSETQALATGLATLAWIRQAEGDPAGARAAIAEAERTGPSAAAAGLLNPVPAERARLAQCAGFLSGRRGRVKLPGFFRSSFLARVSGQR